MVTVDCWLDGDFISGFEIEDSCADGFDGAAEFMADGYGDLLFGDGMGAGR